MKSIIIVVLLSPLFWGCSFEKSGAVPEGAVEEQTVLPETPPEVPTAEPVPSEGQTGETPSGT